MSTGLRVQHGPNGDANMATTKAVNAALKRLKVAEILVWDPSARTHYFAEGNAASWYSSTVPFHVPAASVQDVLDFYFRQTHADSTEAGRAWAAGADVKADTRTVGTRFLLGHYRASGHVAAVTAVTAHGFSAACQCGYRISGQHSDGYSAVSK